MTKRNNRHRRALERIAASPLKFGFKNVVSATIESNLIHRRKIRAQPDVTFETSSGEIHLIEYKGNGSEELLERARKQLEDAR